MKTTWTLKADRSGYKSWFLEVGKFNFNIAEFQFLCFQSGDNKLNCRVVENIILDDMCNVTCMGHVTVGVQ